MTLPALNPMLSAAGLCLAVLCAALGAGAGAAPRVKRDVKFATVGEAALLLDLHAPSTPARGVIVWVHGGAWRAGSRASVDLAAMTERGWAVASVDYRLSPVAKFPAQIHDIKAAIRYLRSHAAELSIPASPLVVAGSSAGGHLAALVGVSNGHAELEGTVGADLATSSDVQGIVSLYGASDLTTILEQSTPHGLGVRVPALELLLGAQPDKAPERARLASPVFHVGASAPPLFLLHGDRDNQMPINQSHELVDVYAKHHRKVRFEVVHGSGHGGSAFTTPARLDAIDAFLREHVASAAR